MTARELNRDWKRLKKSYLKIYSAGTMTANAEETMRKEFKRLYYADTEFSCVNEGSLRIMIVLNRKLQAVPYHQFGLKIEL